ncbi:MAG: hypothetical protein MZV65_37790 [Chromatiales bacterium]|nr:hypothetical protein [Chromatiales bacterium]
MNPAPRKFAALHALLIGLALAASACEAKENNPAPTELPATLLGTWQVSDVRIDPGDTSPWAYKFNVHKYLGRIFVFAPERLTYNLKWWAGDKQHPRDTQDRNATHHRRPPAGEQQSR